MKSVVFVGCSYTAGNGWVDADPNTSMKAEAKDHPNLWVNLCHTNIKQLKDLKLINLGKGGASNTEIFENTVRAMSEYGNDIDTIFCQWTAMPRYNFNVGFELWNTSESLHNLEARTHDVNLNNSDQYPRQYIVDLMNRLKAMHHLHWEILKVVDYTNIITRLSRLIGVKNVFFINGACSWDKNYFLELTNATPEDYTNFTKTEILNIHTRDDKDIYQLYQLAHKQYNDAGGINSPRWINLYNSFLNQILDTNFDNLHPGTKSNKLYYQIIKSHLESSRQ
jgi:hypothetical protein